MSERARIRVRGGAPLRRGGQRRRPPPRARRPASSGLGRPFEILLVDDGSQGRHDRRRILELEARDPRVRAIVLRRNFGQTAAFSAGLRPRSRRGRRDLGRRPAERSRRHPRARGAPRRRLRPRLRLAQASGRTRSSKRLPSFFANRLISWATGVHLHDYGCSLKAMRAEVVRGIRLYGEMHRFIPAVASWMGVNVAEMPVNHRPRTRGTQQVRARADGAGAARPLHRQVPARLRDPTRAPLWPHGPFLRRPGRRHPRVSRLSSGCSWTRRSAAARCCCWGPSCS